MADAKDTLFARIIPSATIVVLAVLRSLLEKDNPDIGKRFTNQAKLKFVLPIIISL
ncbi:MAG: hypothetical protein ACRCU0_00740 [Candidatus Rhabdochlamydia sp.]